MKKLQRKTIGVLSSGLISLKDRVRYLRKVIELNEADALFVNSLSNVFYLTGFTGSSGYVLLTKRKNYFITDFRYKLQSKKEVEEDFEIVIINKFDEIFELLGEREKNVLCERESFTFDFYNSFKKRKFKVKVIASPVLNLRLYKSEDEIEKIRKAQRFSEGVLKKILNILKPGRTKEKDLALEIEYMIKKRGLGLAFPPIVASGAHSALPHAKPRNVVIKNETPLLIDMGSTYKGYNSDMTRTFWVGKNPPDWFREIYKITLESILMVEEKIKRGMKAKDVDSIARGYISERGFGEKFGHGLGHGIGVEIHEKPSVSQRGGEVIEKGLVFTLEPGIYLENKGGVRIEDLVYIDRKGELKILTKFTKRLLKI
ncbi:MAG: aminopeptidase P family protein [Candidatus Hydrothermales bacterium]